MTMPLPQADMVIGNPLIDGMAERMVLGTIISNPAARIRFQVTPILFFHPLHRMIASAVETLGEKTNIISVRAGLKFNDEARRTLSPTAQPLEDYLDELFASACDDLDECQAHVDVLIDLELRRRLVAISTAAAVAARSPSSTQGLADVRAALTTIDAGLGKDLPSASAVADSIVDGKERYEFAPTGVTDLDNKLGFEYAWDGKKVVEPGGFPLGRLSLLAGRPGMGKTTFLAGTAIASLVAGRRVGFYSLEITASLMMARILAAAADTIYGVKGISPIRIIRQKLNPTEKAAVKSVRDWIDNLGDAFLVTHSCRTVDEVDMEATARRQDVVIIDYVQRFAAGQNAGKGDQFQRAASTASKLQFMAISSPVYRAIIAGSQFSRLAANKPPDLSHLAESGTLEQYAAVVIGLDRPELRDPTTLEDRKTINMHILKHTDGKTGTVAGYWDDTGPMIRRMAKDQVTL